MPDFFILLIINLKPTIVLIIALGIVKNIMKLLKN